MRKALLLALMGLSLSAVAGGCSGGQQAAKAPAETSAEQTKAEKSEEKAPETAAASEAAETEAQVNWPTDSVKIFVGGAAGSNMDLKARLVAKYLGDELGKAVIVENHAGAGGITACTEYLAEKPDTNNIMLFAGAYVGVLPLYNDVEYKADDYEIVIGYDTVENGFFASSKLGVTTLDELKEYGKDKTIKFAAGGAGNDTFLMSKVVLEEMGLKSDMVTGKGFAEGLVNCSTGVVDVMYCALNQAEQYVKDGSIVPLAVYNEQAYTGYSDDGYASVPSFKEQGIEAVYSTLSYFGIRSGTDEAIVKKLSAAIQKVYDNPEFKKEFDAAGFVMMEDNSREGTQKAMDELQANMQGYDKVAGE